MDYNGVLVGLGNPGSKYEGTRHNYGFAVVDALVDFAQRHGAAESLNGGKFSCELWRIRLKELDGVWLAAKPQTFMNLSGQSVQPLLAWHKLRPSDLVVAHDELDIPAGEMRFKLGGGNAGHNGLKSITELLGTPDFYRLRLGIGRPPHKGDVTNWVLGRAQGDDAERMLQTMPAALDTLFAFADKGLDGALRVARKTAQPRKKPDPETAQVSDRIE
ncbi:MAG: aminoacyl-tRNA hydrolase [Desulfovibrio sp. MES5]|uniref:aminoacyl-tRNA hydrolase n=1 Tax=Desulfovibrio sp. MES5 TaxID=1899016 RepID=UPI000B9C7D0A|nr:aminoacyl-tRNA hydrolase [Desulfovibrio sp. MES5]OXS27933.1 MAG: aminoacyl-tRNA hydrolase [Desulfovibrio sp. MES5]